jgi:hypothetical protein
MATQNRQGASASARQAAKVALLDNLGSSRSEFDTAEVFNAIENAASEFITRVKINIQNTPDFVITGDIENIQLQTSATSVDIIIENHLLFQDLGVRGNQDSSLAPNSPFTYRNLMPPVDVFKAMIRAKNIQLRNEEFYDGSPSRYEDLTDDQMIDKAAWGMAKNIQKVGFKPRNVYQKEIPQLITDLQATVSDYLSNFLQQVITNNDGTQSNIPLP